MELVRSDIVCCQTLPIFQIKDLLKIIPLVSERAKQLAVLRDNENIISPLQAGCDNINIYIHTNIFYLPLLRGH